MLEQSNFLSWGSLLCTTSSPSMLSVQRQNLQELNLSDCALLSAVSPQGLNFSLCPICSGLVASTLVAFSRIHTAAQVMGHTILSA